MFIFFAVAFSLFQTIAITRGVNLDRSDFKGQNLKGVAFQQSIVRDTDFRGANLVGASFFDATVDGSDFEGAGENFLQTSIQVPNMWSKLLTSIIWKKCKLLSFIRHVIMQRRDGAIQSSKFEGVYLDPFLKMLCIIFFVILNPHNHLQNAIVKEMYVSGATLFEGVKSIEGSDWSDTQLRKDQQKYLCGLDSAKGTNPTTGVDTRESLMCLD